MMKNVAIAFLVAGGLILFSRHFYLLPVHIATVFITIGAVAIANAHALLWVLGKVEVLPRRRLEFLHKVVGWGLLIIITTGATMFWPARDNLLNTTAFTVKMLFVAALVINSVVIARHMETALTRSFNSLFPRERWSLLISGAISTTSWIGALVAAQFLGL